MILDVGEERRREKWRRRSQGIKRYIYSPVSLRLTRLEVSSRSRATVKEEETMRMTTFG